MHKIYLQHTGNSVPISLPGQQAYPLNAQAVVHRRRVTTNEGEGRQRIRARAEADSCFKYFNARRQRRPQSGDSPQSGPEIPDRLPIAGSDTDWREFRARLVAGETASTKQDTEQETSTSGRVEENLWAHVIAQPEKGCLLLAHPLMFMEHQAYFHQAVILIFDHSETGTAGLILNKPLEHVIGKLAGAQELMPEFAENRLFLGGDVGDNIMQILHKEKHLKNCVEIVNGVYMGGFQAAKKAVRREELDAVNSFRWYCRYAGWAPGQLQSECEKGVWFTAAASTDMILHPCALVNGAQHWHRIMQKMGGEYSQLSEALLVEPQIYEEVWGKESYLKSAQQGPLKAEPDEGA